jgi:hypothetical protein
MKLTEHFESQPHVFKWFFCLVFMIRIVQPLDKVYDSLFSFIIQATHDFLNLIVLRYEVIIVPQDLAEVHSFSPS